MTPNGLGHLVQQHAQRVENAQAADSADVLRDDVLSLCPGMQKSLEISVVSSEKNRFSSRCSQLLHQLTPLINLDETILRGQQPLCVPPTLRSSSAAIESGKSTMISNSSSVLEVS